MLYDNFVVSVILPLSNMLIITPNIILQGTFIVLAVGITFLEFPSQAILCQVILHYSESPVGPLLKI